MQINTISTLARENYVAYNQPSSVAAKNLTLSRQTQVSSDQFVGVNAPALEEVAMIEAKREQEASFMETIAELYDTVWGIWENLDLTHFLPVKKRVKRNFREENETEEESNLTETYA